MMAGNNEDLTSLMSREDALMTTGNKSDINTPILAIVRQKAQTLSVNPAFSSVFPQSSTSSPLAAPPAQKWQAYGGYVAASRKEASSTSDKQLARTVGNSDLSSALRRHASPMKEERGGEQLTRAPATNSEACEPKYHLAYPKSIFSPSSFQVL